MGSTIIVRDINPGDKSWIKREAAHRGLSMEEFVRRLIHEKREQSEDRAKPSEAFLRYFGPEHGVELPLSGRYGYRPVVFSEESET